MLKSIALGLTIAALLAAPVLAKSQKIKPNDMGQVEFSTPSGNIGCIYTPEGGTDIYQPVDGGPELSCDRVEPDYVNVLLGPAGEAGATEDPGEQSCCGATNILQYDNELTLDGFVCYSETIGLLCQTESGEHGMLMSKARIVTW
ncbi:MAG: hypothetical protein ABIO40_03590 [Devosia sp.]